MSKPPPGTWVAQMYDRHNTARGATLYVGGFKDTEATARAEAKRVAGSLGLIVVDLYPADPNDVPRVERRTDGEVLADLGVS